MKNFKKNDEGFICCWCGRVVPQLKYSSRDHCNYCLTSLHVDINPGDRLNSCGGILVPVSIDINSKKGYVINYRCQRCEQTHNNRSASDDNFKTILSLMNHSFNHNSFKKDKL